MHRLRFSRTKSILCGILIASASQAQQTVQEFEAPKELTPLAIGLETLPEWITQFSADRNTIRKRFRIPTDPFLNSFTENLLASWRAKLDEVDFKSLAYDDQIDWLLLSREVDHLTYWHKRNQLRDAEALKHIPYASLLARYCASKEHGINLEAEEAAELLDNIARIAEESRAELASAKPVEMNAQDREKQAISAIRASDLVEQFSRYARDTHNFYDGYDPKYMWWAGKPYAAAMEAVKNHGRTVKEKLAGISQDDKDKIVGLPIGDEALAESLAHAWIPYTVDELIQIGERELEWCEREFKKAADELGCEGDSRKALNLVKSRYVDPGEQPDMIRDLAWEAIQFVEENDLLTVPNMAKHGWRLEMMSPEAQRVNPYFLGGDNIIVSFPTNAMTHEEKLMSLRSNNIHFCRATVHHELIPGHHLQFYSLVRYRPYRELFESPFWMEGWALYWEMVLWDKQFGKTPEDRVGMLFWRRHRAARIIFSLNYQSGKWTAEECVKYLTERVGHEPSAAAAEVRRSVMGNYGPLYQAAYMLGGLQLRSLERELVQTGKMTYKEFHEAILKENYLPFELLRAKLLKLPLSKNQSSTWKF
jgi:uncharacterized protein (DUF885 family)